MEQDFNPGRLFALHYHNAFDYPLRASELGKWEAGPILGKKGLSERVVTFKNGYFFLDGRLELVAKRELQAELSRQKQKIAQRAAWVLGRIPFIKMVGITGSLAMQAARADDDIDLIIITAKDTLWLTRPWAYLLLALAGLKVRHAGQGEAKDRLCLNIWLDETQLAWDKLERNVYTAHEIAQIVPLLNKDQTFEKFLFANRWAREYWPRAIKIQNTLPAKSRNQNDQSNIFRLFNTIAFHFQYLYMKGKITREQVGKHRALFHPQNWSAVVLARMGLTK